MRAAATIFAFLFFVLALLFIVAAFHPEAVAAGQTAGRLIIGVVLGAAGGFMLYLASTKPFIQKVEIRRTFEAPGDLNLEKLKCSQCGAQLSSKDVELASGTALLRCPYCDAAYQMEEEPKW